MFNVIVPDKTDESGIDPRVVTYYSPGGAAAEQYRKISTYVGALNGGRFCRSLMITSANSKEGKSISSVNLAMTLAEDKEKSVIVIDADFRSPAIGKLLNVASEKGLSNYLNGEIRLDEALAPTVVNNLMVLPAGEIPEKPAELFASLKMKELISDLEKHFNYILLDAPSVIPFADARSIAPCVDGVLLVVQAGRTRREVVWRAQEHLSSVRAKLLGVIIAQVEYYIPEYIHQHL
ncbi:MAG: CpsD/CapB family tyrosine-protein kinase [Candidatus Omnitrophica bacterium]|nr:CpsD/CapB family tyrosine-protein kinase [Candidatus Omnitrophota bacterium]